MNVASIRAAIAKGKEVGSTSVFGSQSLNLTNLRNETYMHAQFIEICVNAPISFELLGFFAGPQLLNIYVEYKNLTAETYYVKY